VRKPVILIAAGDPAEAARRLEAAGLDARVAASAEEAAVLARREVLLGAGKAEAIAALAGGLAHHLNNLLATALMSLELLAGGPEDADVRAGLEESLRQAVALLRQMLALASSAAGEPAPFQLRSLLTDSQRMLQAVLPPGVELVTDYPPDLPLLFGEPAAVHQLLLRLGLAARETLGEEGRLTLAARVRPSAEGPGGPAPCLQVDVTASGGAWRPPAEAEELVRSLGGSLESTQEGSWRISLPVAARTAP
jgi:signal transduction histidine kinase